MLVLLAQSTLLYLLLLQLDWLLQVDEEVGTGYDVNQIYGKQAQETCKQNLTIEFVLYTSNISCWINIIDK